MSLHSIRRFAPVLGLFLFVGALFVIDRELEGFHYHDVVNYLRNIPLSRTAFAVALTILNYVVLTGYDTLAARYIGVRIPYRRTALAGVIAYSFSIALGHAYLTGGSVRYRFYTGWGVSAADVARIIVFCGSAFWVGYLALGSILFIVAPPELPASVPFPFSLRFVGFVFLGLFLLLAGLTLGQRRRISIHKWSFELPSLPQLLQQTLISSFDMFLAAGVLVLLLPSIPSGQFTFIAGAYLVAVIGGVLSQVPGGLGVFDGILLALLSQVFPAGHVLGALLAYRAIYYLFPLVVGAITFAVAEIYRQKSRLGDVSRTATAWLPRVVPHSFALALFLAGVVLLVSGSLPAPISRIETVRSWLPLPIVELSHFLGSILGVCLLFLSRGVFRRLDAAYHASVGALVLGIIVSLAKGADYEAAAFLTATLVLFLPCRRFFYRRSSLLSQPLSLEFVAAVIGVLAASIWLGLFAYRHVEYSDELWWQFEMNKDAPRFLRGIAGAVAAVLVLSLTRLMRGSKPIIGYPSNVELDQARSIIASSESSDANLALLGDKRILFNEDRSAFVMFAEEGGSWIAMGEPVGPQITWEALVWSFKAMADKHGKHAVFYEVSPTALTLFIDAGFSLFKLGERARVNISTFTLEGSAHKSQRQSRSKMAREGCVFEIVPVEGVPALLPKLREISDRWLISKDAREKGFSLGYFDEDYLKNFPVAVVKTGDEIVAFANVWGSGGKEELSIDLMRYSEAAPGGVMEYLFTELILWGQQEGYQYFSLGMAPLSGMEEHTHAPFWHRMSSLLFKHGEHFYNFQGLRTYKEKFLPEWEPRYLAAPIGLRLPGIVKDLISLISDGPSDAERD